MTTPRRLRRRLPRTRFLLLRFDAPLTAADAEHIKRVTKRVTGLPSLVLGKPCVDVKVVLG